MAFCSRTSKETVAEFDAAEYCTMITSGRRRRNVHSAFAILFRRIISTHVANVRFLCNEAGDAFFSQQRPLKMRYDTV
jgi:predicted HD phosphohydrolase